MGSLITPFVQICLLRLTPQALPASGMLLWITLLAHTLSGVLLATMNLSPARALLAGFVDTALLCVLTLSILSIQRMNTRLMQTLTALAGSGAVVGFLALPVTIWLHAVGQGAGGLAAIALLAIIGWSLLIAAHVLRHALSAPFFSGLIVAVVFYGVSIKVMNSLFPLS